MIHEAALLPGNGQPLHRTQKRARWRDKGNCRGPAGGLDEVMTPMMNGPMMGKFVILDALN